MHNNDDIQTRIQQEVERYLNPAEDKSKCLCGGCMGDAGDETHETLLAESQVNLVEKEGSSSA